MKSVKTNLAFLLCSLIVIYLIQPVFIGKRGFASNLTQTQEEIASQIFVGAQLYYDDKYADAKSHFEKILENKQILDPNNLLLSYSYLGLICNELRLYDKSITIARRAIDINPKKAIPYKILGIAFFHKGLVGKAQTSLIKSIDINPKITYSHYYLGMIHLLKNEHQLATKEFSEEERVNRDAAILKEIQQLKTKISK